MAANIITVPSVILVFVCATVAALVLTPYVARCARRLGAVDLPDGGRKMQQGKVALGGGLVVLAATITALLILYLSGLVSALERPTFLLSILPGVAVLVAVGVADDLWGMRGLSKLAGQTAAVLLLIAQGMQFEVISVFGWEWQLGVLSIPFTLCFFLGTINAFNLLDGADGLAASIGIVVCLTLGLIAGALGSVESALLCVALVGALAGFLRYNIPPASIYLGDTGSMLIGLLVAAVATQCSVKQHMAMALIVPLAICAVPVLDATAALIRRLMTGQSIFTGDRGHLHHALLLRGWSVGKTVLFIVCLTALTCGGALCSYFFQHDWIALLAICLVFAALAAARIFGHVELALIRSQARVLAKVVILGRIPGQTGESAETVHIQGSRGWGKLWTALLAATGDFDLTHIRLNVAIPRLHESYYGNWTCPGSHDKDDLWQISLPLLLGEEIIGKLTIKGHASTVHGINAMQKVLDYLEPFEKDIALLFEDWQWGDTQPADAPASDAPAADVPVAAAN